VTGLCIVGIPDSTEKKVHFHDAAGGEARCSSTTKCTAVLSHRIFFWAGLVSSGLWVMHCACCVMPGEHCSSHLLI
jgi:hypothetical protein